MWNTSDGPSVKKKIKMNVKNIEEHVANLRRNGRMEEDFQLKEFMNGCAIGSSLSSARYVMWNEGGKAFELTEAGEKVVAASGDSDEAPRLMTLWDTRRMHDLDII